MKKLLILSLIFLSGCSHTVFEDEMFIVLEINETELPNTMEYYISRSNGGLYLRDLVGKYSIGDTLIIIKR